MFPAFSQKQGDLPLLKKHYLNIILYIALLTFPLMIGLSLVAKEFVLLFFGKQWGTMIPILSILSGLGALQSIVSLNGLIYNSIGKMAIAFRVSLFTNFILIIAFTIGVKYGLSGVAWSYLIASLLLFFPIYKTAIKQLDITLSEVFRNLKGVLFATVVMAIILIFINLFCIKSLLFSLFLKIGLGGSVYFLILLVFEKKLVLNLKKKFFNLF
jgi:PST family polysaccharide transporter